MNVCHRHTEKVSLSLRNKFFATLSCKLSFHQVDRSFKLLFHSPPRFDGKTLCHHWTFRTFFFLFLRFIVQPQRTMHSENFYIYNCTICTFESSLCSVKLSIFVLSHEFMNLKNKTLYFSRVRRFLKARERFVRLPVDGKTRPSLDTQQVSARAGTTDGSIPSFSLVAH